MAWSHGTEDAGGLNFTQIRGWNSFQLTHRDKLAEVRYIAKMIGLDRQFVVDILIAVSLVAILIITLQNVLSQRGALIQAESDLIQYEDWSSEGQHIQSNLTVLSKNLDQYDEQLSGQDELGYLLSTVSKIGKKWSLEMIQTELLDSRVETDQYAEIKIKLGLRGRYGNILGFISDMENHDTPYFFTNTQFKTDVNDDALIQFSTTLITITSQS